MPENRQRHAGKVSLLFLGKRKRTAKRHILNRYVCVCIDMAVSGRGALRERERKRGPVTASSLTKAGRDCVLLRSDIAQFTCNARGLRNQTWTSKK